MAAMSANLTVFSDSQDRRVYRLDDHAVGNTRLLIQTRRVPTGAQVMVEDTFSIVHQPADDEALGALPNVNFTVTLRRHHASDPTTVAAALTLLRDMVASDEFGNTVDTQDYLTADA